MGRKLAKKQALIINLQNAVLSKRREISDLKGSQETTRNRDRTAAKLGSWRTLYNIVKLPDGKLRPPDKTFNIRAYSNMDRDMWDGGERGETLRGWFQKGSTNSEREIWNAENSGFLVPNQARTGPTTYAMEVRHYDSQILIRSPYTVPVNPAGSYFSMPTPRYPTP